MAAAVSLPAEAAGAFEIDTSKYDYTQLENISVAPIKSSHQLVLGGTPAQNQGFTAFFNLDFTAPDVGHLEISKNSPGNIAPYYTTGRSNSPEQPDNGATRSASVNNILGFSNFSSYLSDHNIDFSKIGLSYGQKSDRAASKTWSLGDDQLGKDWFASADSQVEERIYSANPDDVQISLLYEAVKIVDFGYSDFYNVLDYGDSLGIEDDFDAILTAPLSVAKSDGLSPLLSGLSDSFLQDVTLAGGGIQAVYEEAQVADPVFSTGSGYGVLSFPFPLTLRAVPLKESQEVPEPSALLGLSVFCIVAGLSGVAKARPHTA